MNVDCDIDNDGRHINGGTSLTTREKILAWLIGSILTVLIGILLPGVIQFTRFSSSLNQLTEVVSKLTVSMERMIQHDMVDMKTRVTVVEVNNARILDKHQDIEGRLRVLEKVGRP